MCGIVGIFDLKCKESINQKTVKKMAQAISHRGPDESGYYLDKGISLGHKRLSIIDLETGKQPIHNEDESLWIVYNGEVYNYKELRKELEEKGHKFYTTSDTEVVLHAYEEYGLNFVKKFNGCFAFAIWDSNKKELILVRDRLGIKPLFYLRICDKVIFASEQKSILEYDDYRVGIDYDAMYNFLMFRYNNSFQTLFKDIKKVPPGHILVIGREGIKIKKYWSIRVSENSGDSEGFYTKKIFDLLKDSVRMRLISDVPLGAYLSGGIDSSSVVGLMKKFIEEPKTFSVGFGGYGDDELKYATKVADYFSTDHTEVVVKPDAIKLLPKIIWHLDEPMSDLATIPVYIMSREAKKDVSVILTGEGNDELWGGYDYYMRYQHFFTHYNYLRFIPTTVRLGLIPKIIYCLPDSRLKNKIKHSDQYLDTVNAYMSYGIFNRDDNIYSDTFLKKVRIRNPKKDVLKRYFNNRYSFLNKMLLADVNTLLPNSYFVKADRMTMAYGVEARVPLADHNIVELAFKIPSKLKLKKGIEKYIFRRSVEKIVPENVLYQKKRGFGVPMHFWMNKELIDTFLNDKIIWKRRYFKIKAVNKLLQNLDNLKRDRAQQIWSLITLEIWHRIFIDNDKSLIKDSLNLV